jgi:hypothetical protein
VSANVTRSAGLGILGGEGSCKVEQLLDQRGIDGWRKELVLFANWLAADDRDKNGDQSSRFVRVFVGRGSNA